jgi:outer membrane biosynthesis protein TonB
METSTRNFFAGVATTFVILGVGFGGGLLMANNALKEQAPYQKNRVEQASPVRVILPTTAEAAQAPTLPVQEVSAVEPTPAPSPEPAKVTAPEKKVEKVDTKKAETEVRERRKRYAERKARREAAHARQPMERRDQEPRVLAFGSDEPRPPIGFGFFGNN